MQPESASQKRVSALLKKYEAGQNLSSSQIAEIRAAYPEFDSQDKSGQKATSASDNSEGAKFVKLTMEDQARYAALYKKGWRSLRRWVERGEAAGDPCPLHDPRALMNWWPRHFTWHLPAAIEEAALKVTTGHALEISQEESAEIGATAEEKKITPDPSKVAPPAATLKPIDLESYDPEEGDRLKELKQIQAAKFHQLREALKAGEDCTLAEQKYLKLSETIDKIESRVTERLKKRGLFILRDAVERDLAAAAELLRQTQTSMERRVLELCPSLNAEQRQEVTAAIARTRRSEERILSHLPTLKQDDLLRELAA